MEIRVQYTVRIMLLPKYVGMISAFFDVVGACDNSFYGFLLMLFFDFKEISSMKICSLF